MTAVYRGERVTVVRRIGTEALIVWRGKLRRVHQRALEEPHADA